MRIAVIAYGTRGDVTPFVALGNRLLSEGHEVRFATHPEFEPLAVSHGLEFRPVPGSFQEFIASGKRSRGYGRCTPFDLTALFHPFDGCAEATYSDSWEACADVDGIVCSQLAWPVASLIATRRRVPLATGQAVPAFSTGTMPHPVFPAWPLGSLYNRATHKGGDYLVWRGASAIVDRWRRQAERLHDGCAPDGNIKRIGLVAVSPHVVPRPSDWPDKTHVTGYWWLPKSPNQAVPDHLKTFIEAGPPPVCFGFGSMREDNREELRAIVLDVIERLSVRAVIVGGSGSALADFRSHPRICEVPFVNYDWLFPRVSVVVHQGGAGTVSFCLTAGVPQVIVRYCLDHTFWAWRMRELGVAPTSIVRNSLTSAALERAIRRAVGDPLFRRKAEALAPLIRNEDGLGNAVRILSEFFEH